MPPSEATFLFRKAKTIFDVLNEYSMGDIEGTILNAENAQVLTQRENIPILYDYMQNRYPGRGYQASEAVIRSAKNYLNQAGKPAVVDTEQQKGYNGNSEDDFLDQAAEVKKDTFSISSFEKEAKDIGYETLENVEARKWYLQCEKKIPELIDYTLPLENQAKQAAQLRNQARTQARKLMRDRDLAEKLNISDPNMSWDELYQKYYGLGFRGDDIYSEIIKSAQRSRRSVNKVLGLED